MSKLLGYGSLLAAGLLAFAVTTPAPAQARIVCQEGWRWNTVRCERIPGWWHRDHFGRWLRVHFEQRHRHGFYDRWHRFHDRDRDRDYDYNR